MQKLFAASLILMFSATLSPVEFAKANQRIFQKSDSFILEGQVKRLEKNSEDSHFVTLKATLDLTFKNVGSKPLIIYRNNLWLGGVFLSRTIEDARAYRFIYDSSAWPSNWGRRRQDKLRKALDQATPPADLTLILQPGQAWKYETIAHLGIAKQKGSEEQGRPWEEIRRSPTMWLSVMFEMWPVNIEPTLNPDKPEFGLMLSKRWKSSGELWLDYLTSEPMVLDFSTLNESR